MKISIYVQHEGLNISFMTVKSKQFDIFYNEHEFLSSNNNIKVAVLEPNYFNVLPFKNQLDRLLHKCNCIFVQSMEFRYVIDLVKEYDYKNIVWIMGGMVNYPIKNARIVTECHFALNVSYAYIEELAHLIKEKTNPFKPKEFMFDVFYGSKHRNKLFTKKQLEKVNKPNFFLEGSFFNNTLNKTGEYTDYTHPDNCKPGIWWEPEILESMDDFGRCDYYGVSMLNVLIVPFQVYNKSAYSLVCESSSDNDYVFITEKITKPMLACRLFIVISSHRYLERLQSLGFKTFEGIIDESYDQEIDDHTRWRKAIEQAVWLCNQPQQEVLKKIVPIVLHNLYHLKYLKHNQLSLEIEKFVQSFEG